METTSPGAPEVQTIETQLPPVMSVADSLRQSAIDKYTAPYHIHFVEGVEGHALNPEGAAYNFDVGIALTQLMREKSAGSNEHTKDSLSWFYDKYVTPDIPADQLKKPANVVRAWLTKLGPHNDLHGAEEDLETARQWMLRTEAGRRKADQPSDLNSKEARLVADIDLELAALVDDSLRERYLEEAAEFLEKSRNDQSERGNFGFAALDQATLTSVRIELARQRILGTGQLTNNYDSSQLQLLESESESTLAILESTIETGLDLILEELENPQDESDDVSRNTADNLAAMFEAVTYGSLLDEVINKEALATSRIRLGTTRQDKGTTHTIVTEDMVDKSERKTGFNFNYDIEFTELHDRGRKSGEGILKTVYIQNKMNPDDAPSTTATDYSKRFFAGKEFRFVTPTNLLHLDVPAEHSHSYKSVMIFFARSLKNYNSTGDASSANAGAVNNVASPSTSLTT